MFDVYFSNTSPIRSLPLFWIPVRLSQHTVLILVLTPNTTFAILDYGKSRSLSLKNGHIMSAPLYPRKYQEVLVRMRGIELSSKVYYHSAKAAPSTFTFGGYDGHI